MAKQLTPEEHLRKVRNKRDVSFFDLHSIDQVTLKDLDVIFDVARAFREHKTHKFDLCRGCSQVNIFFENSTRTLSSFDLAAKHLSMDTTSVSGARSSVKKGESYLDTVQTLSSYHAKTLIIRCSEAGLQEYVCRHVPSSVVSAGDGWHEHPTQGLLDALTVLDHFNVKTLKGKIITIVGDILHSRVFGSEVRIMKKLGATVRVAAPETFLPECVENFGVEVFYNVEKALEGAHAIHTIRVQEERGAKGFVPNLREYSKTFGISAKRLSLAHENAILMHAGPVIRDIDVHSVLAARHPQSRVLQMVENGLAIRKALLWLLCKREDGKEKTWERM